MGKATSTRACRGVVLLEVLVAAAVLATAALAIATLAERCAARDETGDALVAAARVAENLLAEALMRHELRTGTERGETEEVPGGTFTRQVVLVKAADGVKAYRVRVGVRYEAGGQRRDFSLERWVVRVHGAGTD